jgi:hypothetical protein
MKARLSWYLAAAVGLIVAVRSSPVMAQYAMSATRTEYTERNLSGPRMGITFFPDGGALSASLKSRGLGPFMSQFGWHFEYLVVPEREGPMFSVQFDPLVGGVEYGSFLPGATFALGARFPGGFEFGLGPNILVGGDKGVNSSLVAVIGKSFNYGGFSIPVDFVLATSPSGSRFSIIFGYSIAGGEK